MADRFERQMGTDFSAAEAEQFHMDDTPSFERVHDTSHAMDNARVSMFREAHAKGYSADLFTVMEKTGLSKRYLSSLSAIALSYRDKTEK